MRDFEKEKYIVNVFSLPEPFAFFDVLTRKRNYFLPAHSHKEFHVNCVTSGSVDVISENSVITVGAGCAFIMPPGAVHELRSDPGYSQIGMDINDVSDSYGIVRKLWDITEGKVLAVNVTDFSVSEYVRTETLLDMSPMNTFKCITGMNSLLLNIIENAQSEKKSAFFKEFMKIAASYDGTGISLDELCRKFAFSKTHLERLTSKEFGCSAVEYFERLRFAKICSDLALTDANLSEIADKYGFCDSSHLSVFFKKRSGMTCAAYRKLAK